MEENTEKLQNQPGENQQEKKSDGRESYEWVQALVCSVLTVVLLFTFGARLIGVDGHSMLPTLQNGDRMLVLNSMLYHDYKYSDVVVLRKDTFLKEPIVKRVIATGGQTVDIDYDTGSVYVDGQRLEEPYIKEEMYRPPAATMQQTHWEVPEGSIFVMGDNRNHSTDSRDDRLGTIDADYILGKAVFALWPMERFGAV